MFQQQVCLGVKMKAKIGKPMHPRFRRHMGSAGESVYKSPKAPALGISPVQATGGGPAFPVSTGGEAFPSGGMGGAGGGMSGGGDGGL
jgi:hypothetical protein